MPTPEEDFVAKYKGQIVEWLTASGNIYDAVVTGVSSIRGIKIGPPPGKQWHLLSYDVALSLLRPKLGAIPNAPTVSAPPTSLSAGQFAGKHAGASVQWVEEDAGLTLSGTVVGFDRLDYVVCERSDGEGWQRGDPMPQLVVPAREGRRFWRVSPEKITITDHPMVDWSKLGSSPLKRIIPDFPHDCVCGSKALVLGLTVDCKAKCAHPAEKVKRMLRGAWES